MADYPPLPCETLVFRAVTFQYHIKRGKLKWQAFKRRPQDTDGLSVGLSKEGATAGFTDPIHGMISIHVGKLRDIVNAQTGGTLDVVQDEDNHACVIGLPYLHDVQNDSDSRSTLEDEEEFLCKQIREKAARLM